MNQLQEQGAELPESGPFALLKHLGTGGFAHTYKARVLDGDLIEDYGTDVVAIKIPLNKKKEHVLKKEVTLNAGLYMHIRDLQASNLVRYLGFESFQNQIVMVMEYVEGNLRDRMGSVGKQRRLDLDESLPIAKGILRGIGAIHREHVFHRDIKPENVLMDGTNPKVADLGIARMLESNELASTTTGTIYYMSPEILSDEGASFTSDIWSFGVTFYEMLTGRLPFGRFGTAIGTMVDLIRRDAPIAPHAVCDHIPYELSQIVMRTLKKPPAERFQTVDEVLAALEVFERGPDQKLERELAAIREAVTAPMRTGSAEKRLLDLLTTHPEEPRVYQCLGELYNRLDRHAEAIRVFKKGLHRAPEDALLCWDLALAYQRVGRRSSAVRRLEQALQLGLDTSLRRHAEMLLRALKGK